MIPVLRLVHVKLWDVHVLALPGGLVVRQLPPLDQVVDVVLPVHTRQTETQRAMSGSLLTWERSLLVFWHSWNQ